MSRDLLLIGALWSFGVAFSALSCGFFKQQPTMIELVEQSLTPPLTLVGDEGWDMTDRMAHYGVPGVSLAVISKGAIAWSKTYGVVDKVSENPVEEQTLFQAASISKPLTSMAVMYLVQNGMLQLDSNVNDYLVDWNLDVNEYNRDKPVTLRHLMSHTGGISVHGFPGYHPDEDQPTLIEILDSDGPTNTWLIRPISEPGEFDYSGGGYCILQQILIEQKGTTFVDLMQELVLDPLEMTRSTFQQPLDDERLMHAATGYFPNGTMVDGRRHVYPEMAAAGLWTTASDLAKFGIDLQSSFQGLGNRILDVKMAREMLSPVYDSTVAHGIFLETHQGETYFGHGGWNAGFSSELLMHRDRDYGVVVMLNSNHPKFIDELIRAVAETYQWQGYIEPAYETKPVNQADRNKICGRYKYSSDRIIEIYQEEDSIMMRFPNSEPVQLFRTTENQYVRRERSGTIEFRKHQGGQYLAFTEETTDSIKFDHPKLAEHEKLPFEYIMEGKFEKARRAYFNLDKENPRDADLMAYRITGVAKRLVDRGELKKAIALLEINSELHPGSYVVFHELAEAYLKDGKQEKALRNYRKSLKFYPQNEEAKKMIEKLENPLVEI